VKAAVHIALRVLCLTLALGILVQSQYRLVIWLGFVARQDYIAANLCVNRNTPVKSCCKGKCFLKERMATEDARAAAPLTADGEREWLYVPPVGAPQPQAIPPASAPHQIPQDITPHYTEALHALLRPPIAA